MSRARLLSVALATLLLGALPLAVAHGESHDDVSPMDTMEASQSVDTEAAATSYWRLSEHAGIMYWHVGLELLAWIVVLPVGVMLSIARSRRALLVQFTFLSVNALALLLGIIYNQKTPDLYENNAHGKTGWIITWIASAWVVMALVQAYAARSGPSSPQGPAQLNAANMAKYQRIQDRQDLESSRWSNDSGQGTERNSASLFGSRSPSVESEEHQQFLGQAPTYDDDNGDEEIDVAAEKSGLLKGTRADRFLSRHIGRLSSKMPFRFIGFFYIVIERTILVQGFVAVTTGIVVYGGIGHGGAVFNVLAHFVKGAIFFGYGLLTLGRWMGAFAEFGWAWNVKPPKEVVGRRRAAIPSAEFTESFVIFLYGMSNVFLEHLAAWGDAWTAQDLEHVSISIMFFGGGLLGMLIESTKMRDSLNSVVLSAQPPSQFNDEVWQQPRQYRTSMNPIPGLIILLLGKMMSSHHQQSMLSTMIHTQWGSMFMMFALARALTYVTLYISPPKSYLPSRPPTEVITSFCLIAGGITFMVSNKDTVAALESYELDAMFTFTITMGFVALLMAWTVALVALKGYATRRENAIRPGQIEPRAVP